MSLFFSTRDAGFVYKVNSELYDKVASIEIAYYQIVPTHMVINSYGESKTKHFYSPYNITAFVVKNPESWNTGNNVYDIDEVMGFSLLRDTLIDLNLIPMAGDVIQWNGKYFEIDSVEEDLLWGGKNPSTNNTQDKHGYNMSIVLRTHLTRRENWQIEKTFFGI